MATTTSPSTTQTTAPKPPIWTNFGFQIIVGLVVGLILGAIARALGTTADGDPNWLTETVSTIGNAYVQLLRVMVVPLVFAAVVSSVARLKEVTNAARLAVQTLLWFAITAFIATVVGLLVGTVSRPWLTAGVDASAAAEPSRVGSWWAFLTGIVPSNIFGLGVNVSESASGAVTATANFNVLQLIIISLAIGIAALKAGEKSEAFLDVVESFLAIIQKILWWIIRLAPIGTAALIARAVATYGWDALGSLGTFVIAIYIGLIVVAVVVYPTILKFHGLSVRQFYRNIWPVTSLGFFTRSSMGVMPVTTEVTERNLGVPRSYASFAVPLGATTKMDGCAAVFPAIAAIFVAQFYGITLDWSHYLMIIFVAVIGSAATAGTTGATVMLTLTLSTLGLPLAGVGLLLAVEPIVDMGRTALNVTGQALVPAIVAKREGILDEDTFNAEPEFTGAKI